MKSMASFTECELFAQYDEMLDECYGMVSVAGVKYDTSTLLKDTDPIRYRCGFLEFLDAEGYNENEDGTYTQENSWLSHR